MADQPMRFERAFLVPDELRCWEGEPVSAIPDGIGKAELTYLALAPAPQEIWVGVYANGCIGGMLTEDGRVTTIVLDGHHLWTSLLGR